MTITDDTAYLRLTARGQAPGVTTVLEVTVPVYNEREGLAASIRRLHAHLRETFPYPFRITIADNASTDGTWELARELADTLPEVTAQHLEQKGRGRALREVWLRSDALILAYMDVDLSTDLDALWPLIAPLMSGHSDVAIGTRLGRGARVVRGAKRELISRCYNLILRATLHVRFSDAQCGFKAIRADVARDLVPLIQDSQWFFDTELLTLAERAGLRIHEVPVDWFDDPDSRVDVIRTARDDLAGVWRVRRALARGDLPIVDLAQRLGRGMPPRTSGTQLLSFLAIGLATTVVHLATFALLRQVWESAHAANAVALALATVVNTSWNRRWTFGITTGANALRHQVQGFAVFFSTLAMTSGALAVLHLVSASRQTWVETTAVALATMTSTATKFLLMKRWMFRGTASRAAASSAAALPRGVRFPLIP